MYSLNKWSTVDKFGIYLSRCFQTPLIHQKLFIVARSLFFLSFSITGSLYSLFLSHKSIKRYNNYIYNNNNTNILIITTKWREQSKQCPEIISPPMTLCPFRIRSPKKFVLTLPVFGNCLRSITNMVFFLER